MLNSKDTIESVPMHRREITLADGRYMIFYTFGDSEADVPQAESTYESGKSTVRETLPRKSDDV